MNYLYQIACALPEISIAIWVLIMSFIVSFKPAKESDSALAKATVVMIAVLLLIMLLYNVNGVHMKTDVFTYNNYSHQMKIFVLVFGLIGTAVLLIEKILNPILYILILAVMFGLMIAVSSGTFITLFLGLELYSIGISLLIRKREMIAKYITINAIMGALFLYGLSLYYLNFGTISCGHLENISISISGMLGILLIMSYLLFKVNVAPFHTWSIDVYSKSSSLLALFLDSFLKFVLFAILSYYCLALFHSNITFFQTFLLGASILSMIIGGIAPFSQDNIKKFIAYSSVGHIGFAVTVLCTFTNISELKYALTYVFSYLIASLCFFTGFICIKKQKNIKCITELAGTIKEFPIYAYTMMCGLLAMVGLPPFFTFLAEINILKMLLLHGQYVLIMIVFVYTLMTILYTINIIKEMYANANNYEKPQNDTKTVYFSRNALCISLVLILVFGSIFFDTIDKYMSQIMISSNYKFVNLGVEDFENLFSNNIIKDLYNNLMSYGK